MSAQEILRIEQHALPKIINTLCITVVMLTLIYTIYSYLLVRAEIEEKPFLNELNMLRVQIKEEREKRQNIEQENLNLNTKIITKEDYIKRLLKQLENTEQEEENNLKSCRIEPQEVEREFIHKALQNTLSRQSPERFEGFSILMNNLDYLDEQLQREVIEFYLSKIDKRNRSGVYYAVFILSQLNPLILKEYHDEIEQTFGFVSQQPGWEKTSYKYCQLGNKINGTSP